MISFMEEYLRVWYVTVVQIGDNIMYLILEHKWETFNIAIFLRLHK